MHLQESGEMYLETILLLSQQKAQVRSIDVAEHMGYSKPSVSRAMGLLKSGNYIRIDASGLIQLTETGRARAEAVYERHRFLTEALERSGVDAETAAADACKIEHYISDKSFQAIKRLLLEHPWMQKDPVETEG